VKTLALALALVLSLSAPVAAQSREEIIKLQEAKTFLDANSPAKAKRAAAILHSITKRRPDFADAHRLLGHAYSILGDRSKARAAFIDALAHGRLTSDVLARLVQLDRRAARTPSLLSLLRLLAITEPDNPSWQLLYGDLLAGARATEQARLVFETLRAKSPADPQIALRLGNLALGRGDDAAAALAFEAAWTLGAQPAALPRTLAGLWQRLGEHRAALSWTRKILPKNAADGRNLQLRRGTLLWRLEDASAATAELLPLCKSGDPKLVRQAAMILGNIAQRAGQSELAVRHWSLAVEHGQSDPQLFRLLAQHHIKNKAWAAAATMLGRLGGVPERSRADRELQVRCLIRAKRQAAAKAVLSELIEEHGIDEDIRQLLKELLRLG